MQVYSPRALCLLVQKEQLIRAQDVAVKHPYNFIITQVADVESGIATGKFKKTLQRIGIYSPCTLRIPFLRRNVDEIFVDKAHFTGV